MYFPSNIKRVYPFPPPGLIELSAKVRYGSVSFVGTLFVFVSASSFLAVYTL